LERAIRELETLISESELTGVPSVDFAPGRTNRHQASRHIAQLLFIFGWRAGDGET
jgi:hypothetical protein